MKQTGGISKIFKELTKSEKQLYHNLDMENFFRETIIKTIKKKSAIHQAELNKYSLIEEIINRLKYRRCPECDNKMESPDDYVSYFVGIWKCDLGHSFGFHEIQAAYLWKIMDIIDGKVDGL